MSTYTYSLSGDFSGNLIQSRLFTEITNAAIGPQLLQIQNLGDDVKISFATALSNPTETDILDTVVSNHPDSSSAEPPQDIDYGPSATDPVGITPNAGDRYYNTAINHEMRYDGIRGKWLSVATFMDGAGINGTTNSGVFYKRWNGMTLANDRGPFVPKGTIVYIGYQTTSTTTHTYEVRVNGSVIATLDSGGSASASDDTINADFPAGNMASRNNGPGNASNLQSVIYYKLRA